MSSEDEPIFEAEDGVDASGSFEIPASSLYVGTFAEEKIDREMPTLYLDFEVARTLQSEGQRSIETDKEVAGILLGTTSEDAQSIKVSHIAIARDEDSSPVHFKFTYSVWDDLIDQMESLSREAGEELLLLGWYHTHPNMSVFLSRYDLRTHRDFHRPYQFALVLAPRLGTEDTSVGFFCNRGGGTPLLPGVRMFGVQKRGEVAGAIPWSFQVVEAEGIEEGEQGSASGSPGSEDDSPELQQLGVVRKEDPRWLTLGRDPAEGAVLTILEGMAASVVESRHDRIGVLLGTSDENNHITIDRVRFLGALVEDPALERRQILGSIRFMAQTFPASGKQKILGMVRIVSPHRFELGDVYDPVDHNIRIALLLAEVGYDLDAVPFQVGLVLYPGIEADTLFFQVFAQNKASRPVPLMSLQAYAPPSQAVNERYEPVGEELFEVEVEPCMKAPDVVPPSRLGEGLTIPQQPSEPPFDDSQEVEVGTGSGINWDEVEDDAPPRTMRGPVVAVLLLLGLAAVVTLLVTFRVLGGASDSASTGSAESAAAAQDSAPLDLAAAEVPFHYSLVGCGPDWNPSLPCEPFAQEVLEDGSVDLLRLRREPAYLEATIQPIEAWLLREGSRQRLVRRGDGADRYVFSVLSSGEGWSELWDDGSVFEARLVVLPRGAELEKQDELSFLRRSEPLEIRGPASSELGQDGELALGQAEPAGEWGWKSGESIERVTWDAARSTFAAPLRVTGGASPSGRWLVRFHSRAGGPVLAQRRVEDPPVERDNVDLTRALTELLRDSEVVEALEAVTQGNAAVVRVSVLPPRTGSTLLVDVALTGEVSAEVAVEHKVCVMLMGPGGQKAEGRARVGSVGVIRPTFTPGTEAQGAECADGGRTGRWQDAVFGPGRTPMKFIHEDGAITARRGEEQDTLLPARWSAEPRRCLAVTIVLDEGGNQIEAARVQSLYEIVDGRCTN